MRREQVAWRDAAAPLLLAGIGTVEISTTHAAHWPAGVCSLLVGAALLGFVRRAPVVVPPLIATSYVGTGLVGFDVSPCASWIVLLAAACFGAGLYRTGRWRRRLQTVAASASVLAVLVISLAGLRWLTDFEPNPLFGMIACGGPFGLGIAVRETLGRQRIAAVEAERARFAIDTAYVRAARIEREQLTVELHDAIANTISEMTVRTTAIADVLGSDPVMAGRELARVAASGRAGLAETGRLIRLLRDRPASGEVPPITAMVTSRRARRIGAGDVVIAGLLVGAAAADIIVEDVRPVATMIICYALAGAALVGRRAFAAALPVVTVAVLLAGRIAGLPVEQPACSSVIIAVACYLAGRHGRRRWATIGAVLIAVVALAATEVLVDRQPGDLMLIMAFTIAPLAVGIIVRTALERTLSLAAATERARLEEGEAAERAAADERRHVARELHDVLASSLSVMSVQAALAAELVATNPAAAADAVSQVVRAGRAALTDFGQLFRLSGGDTWSATAAHRTSDLTDLVDGYARTGLRVELDCAGVDALPTAVDVSIYRLIQEGLTNVIKHAPGSDVRIRIRRAGVLITVEVSNGVSPLPPPPVAVSGHGLLGMRERVALLGGGLRAEPTGSGGFVLSASIPIAEGA